MTSEAFTRIERAFGVRLPEWYRASLVQYPLSEADESLYSDEESIVRANEELRRDGWWDMPWPQEFFAIGDTGCGDTYFIVPSTGDRRVFIADHEGGPAPSYQNLGEMVESDSFEKFIRERQETIVAAAEIVERRKNKKWWQFWI
jgi:hypothetical protein